MSIPFLSLPDNSIKITSERTLLKPPLPIEKIKTTFANMKSSIEKFPDYSLNANFYSREMVDAMKTFIKTLSTDTSKFQDCINKIQSSTKNFNEKKIDSTTYLSGIEKVKTDFLNMATKINS